VSRSSPEPRPGDGESAIVLENDEHNTLDHVTPWQKDARPIRTPARVEIVLEARQLAAELGMTDFQVTVIDPP
jgi:hypothetical protein